MVTPRVLTEENRHGRPFYSNRKTTDSDLLISAIRDCFIRCTVAREGGRDAAYERLCRLLCQALQHWKQICHHLIGEQRQS